MTPEDSKVEMFIPTDRRRWKPEETKAPGNICGVSWKMRETPMGLLNPPAFTGAPPPCWSLSQMEASAHPQRITLHTT